MQTYEFYAKPENGVIPIPEKYVNQITNKVMVIIMDKNSANNSIGDKNVTTKSDLLLPPTMDTSGWKFNREEANER